MRILFRSVSLVLICISFQAFSMDYGSLGKLIQISHYQRPTENTLRASRSKIKVALKAALDSLSGLEQLDAREQFKLDALEEALDAANAPSILFQDSYDSLCTSEAVPVDTKEPVWLTLRALVLKHARLSRALENGNGESQMAEHLSILQRCLNLKDSESQMAIEGTSAKQSAQNSVATEARSKDGLDCDAELRARYLWLYEHAQASELLEEIRKGFYRNNQYLVIRGELLPKLVNREFRDVMSFDRFENGAHVLGTANVVGTATGGFANHPKLGEVRMFFKGVGSAPGVQAQVKRATVWSDITTHLKGFQSVWFDAENFLFKEGRLEISASQSTQPYASSYATRRGLFSGRMRANIALRVANGKVPEMNAKGAQEARAQLSSKIKTELTKNLLTVNTVLADKFTFPMKRQDLLPKMQVSSTEAFLQIQGLFAGPGALGVFGEDPPRLTDQEGEIYLSVHESALNNSNRIVSQKEIDEAKFREVFFEKMGFTLAAGETFANDSLSYFKFAKEDPLRVSFQDGKMELSLKLRSFTLDGKTYEQEGLMANPKGYSYEVKAAYEIVPLPENQGLMARRLGEVVSSVTEIQANQSQKGVANESDLLEEKTALQEVANRFLPKKAYSHGILLKGEKQSLGKLIASEAKLLRGWLCIAWRHFP